MCGRYTLSTKAEALEERFHALFPAAVYEALLGASSKGSYFNRVIRGRFPYALCASAQAGSEAKV